MSARKVWTTQRDYIFYSCWSQTCNTSTFQSSMFLNLQLINEKPAILSRPKWDAKEMYLWENSDSSGPNCACLDEFYIHLRSPKVSTTPLRQWGFRQYLPFSWTTLRGKHCWHPIAIIGVVDTFGQNEDMMKWSFGKNTFQFFFDFQQKGFENLQTTL